MNLFTPAPTISVVVSTNGRLAGLQTLVKALDFQRFRNFELCVVAGPADDGTAAYLEKLEAAGRLKAGFCPQPNISRSRNIGIAMAAGDLVAFIDDDAIPEPTWLGELVGCLGNSSVAGAGGSVLQPDGFGLQFRFSYCDRFGAADHTPKAPVDDGAFPLSLRFPHVMGTNCMFRREAVVAAGGFDEEYEYYLDEADLCCRLIDAGFSIKQNAAATVHHKFLAGTVRDSAGITVRYFPILKNQIYFSLMNGRGHAAIGDILVRSAAFIDGHRTDIRKHAREGRTYPLAPRDFEDAAERAWETGLLRGLSGKRRCADAIFFSRPSSFRRFLPGSAEAEGAVVFVLSRKDSHEPLHRATMMEAAEVARRGRVVRVFERLESPAEPQSVDFIDGLWLHRIRSSTAADAVAAEIDRISAFCPIEEIIDRTR